MMPSALKLFLLVWLLASMSGQALGDLSPDLKTFDKDVKPLLQRYCVQCHGATESEGNLRLDEINPDVVTGEHFDRWEDIREAFNSGEMPPEDQQQPTPKERETITRWLDLEFKKAKQVGMSNKRGRVRRLTRYELQHALEDLLHVSVSDQINQLPEESTSIETGLKNSTRLLMMSGPHLESYLNVILAVTNKMKVIVGFKPYQQSLEIANLDTNPAQTFTRDGKKIKPPLAEVQRVDSSLVINPKGYIDLPIPSISQYMFQTVLSAKSDQPGQLGVSIGFTRSDIDPRQNLAELGFIDIAESETWTTYRLNAFPDTLPRQMTRALDRPFFIRITNRGRQKIELNGFDYNGNVTSALISTLIPTEITNADVERHVRRSILAFLEKRFADRRRKRSSTDIVTCIRSTPGKSSRSTLC